jgi:hypothetical protein
MTILTLISQYSSSQRWIEGLRSMDTNKSYALHLLQFCEFHKTDPGQLLNVNIKELKEMIINYILVMKKAAKNSAGKPKRGEKIVNSIISMLKE